MNIPDTIRSVQFLENRLRVKDGDGAPMILTDGDAGPQTWGAIYARYKTLSPEPPPAPPDNRTSDRSEQVIRTLHPKVQPYARALWHSVRARGIEIEIISGTRTYAEQDALFAQGRTTPGNIVTNAPGGYSNHNFGVAFDVGVFVAGQYVGESPAYNAVGMVGEQMGLTWGGNWHSFEDDPHFELHPSWAANLTENDMLAQMRDRHASGTDIFA